MKKKITTRDLTIVGLMAAMVFVCTMFLGIRIPTPTGTTMLKTANAICLMGGLLFGGWRGGLAAGLGSAIFDLTMPEYAAMCWLTFVRFFIMAFVCGWIAHSAGAAGRSKKRNVVAAVSGAFSYFLMYVVHNIVVLVAAGSALWPAVVSTAPKMLTSFINAVFAIVVSLIFTPPLRRALEKAKVL